MQSRTPLTLCSHKPAVGEYQSRDDDGRNGADDIGQYSSRDKVEQRRGRDALVYRYDLHREPGLMNEVVQINNVYAVRRLGTGMTQQPVPLAAPMRTTRSHASWLGIKQMAKETTPWLAHMSWARAPKHRIMPRLTVDSGV